MKSEEEIRKHLTYLEGYIAGQRNSVKPYDREVERAKYEINMLKWVLDEE